MGPDSVGLVDPDPDPGRPMLSPEKVKKWRNFYARRALLKAASFFWNLNVALWGLIF